MLSIRLSDCKGKDICVGDILYDSERHVYYTVFEVPGGFAIEGNPECFGLYSDSDPFPIYESTADPQTSSYIRSSCEVIGNIEDNKNLYNKIRDEYELKKNRILQGRSK